MSSTKVKDDASTTIAHDELFVKDSAFPEIIQARILRRKNQQTLVEQLAHDLLDTNNIRPFYDKCELHMDDHLLASLNQLKLGMGPPKCSLHLIWNSFIRDYGSDDPELRPDIRSPSLMPDSKLLLEKVDQACKNRVRAIWSNITSTRAIETQRPCSGEEISYDSASDDSFRDDIPSPEVGWNPTMKAYGWSTALKMSGDRTENSALHDLKKTLERAKANAAFCCGGQVKVHSKDGDGVILHWDNEDHSQSDRMSLSSRLSPEKLAKLGHLREACQPASFGRNGQDVLDESYRSAGKLDETHFTTNFDPHWYGIVDEIKRCLLPSYLGNVETLGLMQVRAELYKLNIYSGPHGRFKAHVDTPRYVSLAKQRTGRDWANSNGGGALIIRKNNSSIRFEWGALEPETFGWASFYSDCEHEILPLAEGNRLTFTYNLYVSGPHTAVGSTLKISTLPFWHEMSAVLHLKDFLTIGGKIGMYCNHSYAHSIESHSMLLHEALKGVDAVSYAVLRVLGLTAHVLPIIQKDSKGKFSRYNMNYEMEGKEMTEDEESQGENPDSPGQIARSCIRKAYQNFQDLESRHIVEAQLNILADCLRSEEQEFARRVAEAPNFQSKLGMIEATMKIPGFFNGAKFRDPHWMHPVYLGNRLHPVTTEDCRDDG
ncbi:MAG: hypothetical protein Q9160_007467 [Pyrenula sp. 1 TL-2023]